eukprot:3821625-Pleurochrysis_carterae.AAC.2
MDWSQKWNTFIRSPQSTATTCRSLKRVTQGSLSSTRSRILEDPCLSQVESSAHALHLLIT